MVVWETFSLTEFFLKKYRMYLEEMICENATEMVFFILR